MTDPKPTPFVPASFMMLYNDAPVLVDGRMGRLYGACKPVDGRLLVSFRGGACGSFPASDVRFLLDTPLSMCHAARWLATRAGWDMRWITTAPSWERVETDKGPVWKLSYGNNALYVTDVPGISDLTDPAEALAAACVAVGGAS